MGGGGGDGSQRYTESNIEETVRKIRDESRDQRFETEVNEYLYNILNELSRDSRVTKEQLDLILNVLNEDDIGTFETRFGGSVSKHTYIEGLSDVDVLLLVNNTDFAGWSPSSIDYYIRNRLLLSNLNRIEQVTIGKLAVTVTLTDGHSFQFLPTIKTEDGYKIPNPDGKWSSVVRPKEFSEKLSEVNKLNNNNLISTIRLAKKIISNLPKDQQLSGYHIESMAVKIFKKKDSSIPCTNKKMIRSFFEKATDEIRRPIKDRTGQSYHVDDNLGAENSLRRIAISQTLNRIAKDMKYADDSGRVDKWKEIVNSE